MNPVRYAGIVTIVLASLGACVLQAETMSGPQGDDGPQGPQGEAGPLGSAGPPGASPFRLVGQNAVYTDGNVGIGTITAGSTLSVNGNISVTGGTSTIPLLVYSANGASQTISMFTVGPIFKSTDPSDADGIVTYPVDVSALNITAGRNSVIELETTWYQMIDGSIPATGNGASGYRKDILRFCANTDQDPGDADTTYGTSVDNLANIPYWFANDPQNKSTLGIVTGIGILKNSLPGVGTRLSKIVLTGVKSYTPDGTFVTLHIRALH